MRRIILFFLLLTSTATTPTIPKSIQDYVIKNETNYKTHTEIVTLTGYSSRVQETDDTPFITATCDSVQIGCLAMSPDLIAKYGYYQIVFIEGFLQPFLVLDTMNPRHTNRADIWWPNTAWAIQFGQKRGLNLTIFTPNQLTMDELYICNRRIPIRRTSS